MQQLKNDRLLKTIAREPVDATPIWIMRQAGRYLPEYRAVRERAGSFMALCKTPELVCEVSLQPLRRFALDAAIIFSDILTFPDAMGLGLQVIEKQGPIFTHPCSSENAIKRLTVPNLDDLRYVYDAIRLVQAELAGKVPLLGFCGSPWTLAVYMIEGQSVPSFPTALKMLREEPALLHSLLDILAKSVFLHLSAQIDAGVQIVMLFDTWGELLTADLYAEFSLNYLQKIIGQLANRYNNKKIPVILFAKGGHHRLEQMAGSNCDVISLDWQISLADARKRVGTKVALQGNMEPAYLLNAPEMIRDKVAEILGAFGHGPGHIFNLGHGITPDVPPEHVAILVNAVHELSQAYHQPKE